MVDFSHIYAEYFFADRHDCRRQYEHTPYYKARDKTTLDESDMAPKGSE